MMHRKSMNPSKATTYHGDGRFFSRFGGCMFEREKTDQEKAIEDRIRARYDTALGESYIAAGTNMGKPYFLMQLRGGYDIESTVSMEDLEKEVDKWYEAHKETGMVI